MASGPGRWVAAVLVGAGWSWLAVLVALGLAGGPPSRPRFEAAGLAFGAGLVLVALAWAGRADRPRARPTPWFVWALPAAAALAAYGWTLALGPLSDDFVLEASARRGDWTPEAWTFYRPVLLASWQALGGAGGWPLLHALNVVLHAVNAALAAALACGWLGAGPGLAAGLLVALFPAGVEAVAWASGAADVLATCCVLTAALVVQRTEAVPLAAAVASAAAVIGVGAKETAVVLPALLALGALVVRPTRAQRAAVGAAGASVFVLLLVRLASSPAAATHLQQWPVDRRGWKDLLVKPFAGVAVPLRTTDGPGLDAFAGAACLLALLAVVVVTALRGGRRGPDESAPAPAVSPLRMTAAGLGWTLAAALPLLTQFHVAPSLEGSRYLYLPAVGAALVLASAFAASGRWARGTAGAALVGLLAVYGLALARERTAWQRAATTRDAVLTDAARFVAAHRCAALTIDGVPGDIEGVFVFRNGLREALADLAYDRDGGGCVARWTADARRLVPTPGPVP
ncbi:MAG: hypothetical protein AB7O28_02650 [Vicinamibacterales bacterium]